MCQQFDPNLTEADCLLVSTVVIEESANCTNRNRQYLISGDTCFFIKQLCCARLHLINQQTLTIKNFVF